MAAVPYGCEIFVFRLRDTTVSKINKSSSKNYTRLPYVCLETPGEPSLFKHLHVSLNTMPAMLDLLRCDGAAFGRRADERLRSLAPRGGRDGPRAAERVNGGEEARKKINTFRVPGDGTPVSHARVPR